MKTRVVTFVSDTPSGEVYKQVKMSAKVHDADTAYFMIINGIDANCKRVIAMTDSEARDAMLFDLMIKEINT